MVQGQSGIKFGQDPSPVVTKHCPFCKAKLIEVQIYKQPGESQKREFGQIRARCRRCKRDATFTLVVN